MRSRSKVVHVDRFSPRKKTCRIPYPWVEERSTKGRKASQYRHAERDAAEKENTASFLQLAVFPIARSPFARSKMPGRFVWCRLKRAPAMRKRCFFRPEKTANCTFHAGNAVFAAPRYEIPRQSTRTERGADAKESIRRQRGGAYDPGCFSARSSRTSGIRSARTNDGWGRFARRRRLARMPYRLLSPYALPRPE